MSELIINSKLATAGPAHFELQKCPPKENYIKKMLFHPGFKPGTSKIIQTEICSSTTRPRKHHTKHCNEFFMCLIQIELMINSLMMNQLENMS